MTIVAPLSGETSEGQLEEDEFHMLWLVHRNRGNSGRVQILLSAALQTGWRIVHASHPRSRRCSTHTGSGVDGCGEGWRMSDIDRPIAVNVQRCPSCESPAVRRFGVVDGKVWLVCGRCDLRWSIAERRSPLVAEYHGFERRVRLHG